MVGSPNLAAARVIAAVLLGAALAGPLVAKPAMAQLQADWKARSAARKLGVEGIKLFREERYAEALDRFERAYALFPAPTLGVRAARSLVELGRLVEASERYRTVATADLGPSPRWQYRKAQQEARREREALLERIPELEVSVKGPRGDGVEVLVDDEVLPPELVDAAHPVDPGEHEVRVRRDDVTLTETAQVPEGETSRVVVQLPPLPEPPPAPEPEPRFDWGLWTWVGYGVGAGGLVAAAVNGGIALSQRAHLEERCPSRVCPPSAHDAADAFDATRVATTIGFVVGGIGAAAGTTLLLLSPETDEEGATLEAAFGAGSLRLRGRF